MKLFACCMLLPLVICAQDLVQVHGYIQGRFTNQEGVPDRLEIRRARLTISGDPFAQFSYAGQVDVAKKPYLLDASVTWKPAPALHFTAGQFKIPFSTESLQGDQLSIPIERSRAVNTFAPGRDTGVQGRDVGLEVAGGFERQHKPWIEYAAGIFRGQPLLHAPAAHDRAIAARALFHPVAGLTVGGDWYGSVSVAGGPVKRRLEAEGTYQWKQLTLQMEQIWARDGKQERRGGYALGAWRFSQRWEGMSRAEWLEPDLAKPATGSLICEAGTNYYYGKHVKLQADVGARQDQSTAGLSGIFLAQLQLGF